MDPKDKQLFAEATGPCMFEHCFVCTMEPAPPGSKEVGSVKIIYRYPPCSQEDLLARTVPLFCYPDPSASVVSDGGISSETFPFVLTDEKGTKRYGYCRRYADPAKDGKILSELFSTVLGMVEQKRRISAIEVYTFLKSLQSQLPIKPGESIAIKSFGKQFGRDGDVLSRPAGGDLWNDLVSFQTLIQAIGKRNTIYLMNALMFEQKIVLTSSSISKLATCALATMALIQPFIWELVFIPVLPVSLVDYTCSPIPFVMGVMSHLVPKIQSFAISEIFLVDLDNRKITNSVPFPSFPQSDKDILYNSFRVLTNSMKSTGTFENRAFAATCNSFFIRMFGNYRRFLPTEGKKGQRFDTNGFVDSRIPTTREFYSKFAETQTFSRFCQVREEWVSQGLAFESFPGVFERELTRRGFNVDPDPEVTKNHFSLIRVIKEIFIAPETLLTREQLAETSTPKPQKASSSSRSASSFRKKEEAEKQTRMTNVQQQALAFSRTIEPRTTTTNQGGQTSAVTGEERKYGYIIPGGASPSGGMLNSIGEEQDKTGGLNPAASYSPSDASAMSDQMSQSPSGSQSVRVLRSNESYSTLRRKNTVTTPAQKSD